MRINTLFLLGILLAPAVRAQQAPEEVMKAAANGNLKIEEDKTPFRPLGFTGSYTWEVNTYRDGTLEKNAPMRLHMAFDDEHMAWAPQARKGEEEGRMVFDLKNKVNYFLKTEGGKHTGIKMKAMRIGFNEAMAEDDGSPAQVERTNDTKVIEGHSCRKYTYGNDDGHGEAWIAGDVKFNAFQAVGNMLGAAADGWQMAPYPGMVLECTWSSTDGGKKVVMHVRDLVVGHVDPALFSTAGYEMQDMTNLPMFGK